MKTSPSPLATAPITTLASGARAAIHPSPKSCRTSWNPFPTFAPRAFPLAARNSEILESELEDEDETEDESEPPWTRIRELLEKSTVKL